MKSNARNSLAMAGAALLALTALTACGGGTENQTSAAAQQPAANAASGSPSATAATLSSGEVSVRADNSLGDVVVDGKGMSVYVFAKDTKPGSSSCEGECAAQWPPVPAGEAKAATGINQELLGSITRTDGSKQLTLAGPETSTVRASRAPGTPPRPTAGRPASSARPSECSTTRSWGWSFRTRTAGLCICSPRTSRGP